MKPPCLSATWPKGILKGWKRVELKAGVITTVTSELPCDDLAFCNRDGEWVVEPGDFELMAGPSSRDSDLMKASFQVVKG